MSYPLQSGQLGTAAVLCAVLCACSGDPASPDASTGESPPRTCAVGERKDGERCVAPGIPAERCAEGFEGDGRDACSAILPAPCASGTMAVPGEPACREVAPCPADAYGEAPREPSTVYVEGDFVGTSDGTADHPFRTIQEAVDVASDGAVIAIAAGTYVENVYVRSAPVRLWGRCPATVTLVGGPSDPAILVTAKGQSEIHDLSVSGEQLGIGTAGGAELLVDRVWVHDTGLHGVHANDAFGPPRLTVRRSLIEGAGQFGIVQRGAEVTVEESVIRGTRKYAGEETGAGISVLPTADAADQRLTIRRSVIERSYNVGVFVAGAEALVEATLVRDSEPDAADQLTGQGIFAAADVASGKRATLEVIGSLIDNNRSVGIHVYGSDLTLETTVVRATKPRLATDELGHGVTLEHQDGGSTATVSDSVLEANHNAGMLVSGSDLVMSGTRIRDTRPQASDLTGAGGLIVQMAAAQGQRATANVSASAIERNHPGGLLIAGADVTAVNTVVRDSDAQLADRNFGRGVEARYDPETLAPATLTLSGCLVEGNHDAGVLVAGAEALLEDTEVRGTLPRSADSLYGDGLTAFLPPEHVPTTVTVRRSRFSDNARAGVSSFGARVVMSEATLDCNPIHLDGETAFGQASDFDELEPNECGCDSEAVACSVQSASLAAPEL